MPSPLLSIVMPTFNQEDYITVAIESVLNQSYDNIELIVQDGGSTDGTVDILKATSENDPRLRWQSNPDSGPADALNKAFKNVRGELIGWLNSDDYYTQGTFDKVVQSFAQNPTWMMSYGHAMHVDDKTRVIGNYPTLTPEHGPEKFKKGCFICQPTVFFKYTFLSLLGRLDTELKTAFDFDLWLRAFKAFPDRIGFINSCLANSRLHESCITNRERETVALEGLALTLKYFGLAELHWATTYLEELRRETNNKIDFSNRAVYFLSLASEFLSETQITRLKNALHIKAG